jgi:hypothetical protein
MSNKNLLNESTIRKFMKLASIEPLASDFLGRIQEAEEELEEGRDKEELDEAEEDLEEGHDKDDVDEGRRDDDLDERGDMMFKDDEEEMDMGMDAEEEVDMDMGMDAEAGGKMVDVDAFIAALESALENTMGEPAEVEYEEEEAELDAEEPEADLDMGAELDLDAEEEEEEEEEDLAEAIYKEVLKKISKKK